MNQDNLLRLLSVGDIEGSLRFSLMVFSIQKQSPSLFSYEYTRGVKSPFSEEFYEDLRDLEIKGVIEVSWKKEGVPKKIYSIKKPLKAPLEKEYFKLNFMPEEELLLKVYKEINLSQYEIGDRII